MNPVSQASDVLRTTASEAREKLGGAMNETRERIEDRVQKHPLRTVLLSVGAGVVIGMILGLGRRRRSD